MDIKKQLKEIFKDAIVEVLPGLLDKELRKANLMNSEKCKEKELLNITEAAEFLSYAKQSIYGMVSKGTIPFIKRPGSKFLRFRKKELEEWSTNTNKGER